MAKEVQHISRILWFPSGRADASDSGSGAGCSLMTGCEGVSGGPGQPLSIMAGAGGPKHSDSCRSKRATPPRILPKLANSAKC